MYSRYHSEEANSCRLCREKLPSESIVSLHPFPLAAQHFLKSNKTPDEVTTCSVFQCTACGLVQLKASPVSYYRSVITAAVLSKTARDARFAEIEYFVNKYGKANSQAVEVGCGKGGMLDVIKDVGLNVTGIEFEKEFVDEAHKHNRQVVQTYLTEFKPDKKYDAVFSFNYLEHQPDVAEFIKNIDRISTDNALVYITVPNLTYLLKTKSLYEFVPDHLVYFTEETLRLAFQCNGFDILESQIINNENDILLIAQKRQKLDLSDCQQDVDELIDSLNKLADSYLSQDKKLAVWGAGHRTLALLALSNLTQIHCIVDSAPFKQGLYSPVLLKPIISPQEFAQSDIDAVIVAVPGIYPKEVIKTIREFEKSFDMYCIEDNKLVSYY
jgi:SAM-dependent methyltransferase